MDKIVILDTLNFIYKGDISFGEVKETSIETEDFTLVYNFFRNLRALIEKLNPDKIFAVKEGSNNFRYKLLEGYKSNRLIKLASKTKEEVDNFNRQRDIIFDLLKYLPITQVFNDDVEADDCIYSLVDHLREEEITIVSNDSDLIQLLQKGYKNVKIYNPFKKIYIECPKSFILIKKALMGDVSDNIPGIVGIGKKKAETLASDPEALKIFLETNEEARIRFNDNIEIIKLKLLPPEDLILIDHEVNFFILKESFKTMDFQSIIRTDVWEKFVATFKDIKL